MGSSLPPKPAFAGPSSEASSSATKANGISSSGLLKKGKAKISIAIPVPIVALGSLKTGALPAKPVGAINFESLHSRGPSPDKDKARRTAARDPAREKPAPPRERERERGRNRSRDRGHARDRLRDDSERDRSRGEGPSRASYYSPARSPTPPPRRRDRSVDSFDSRRGSSRRESTRYEQPRSPRTGSHWHESMRRDDEPRRHTHAVESDSDALRHRRSQPLIRPPRTARKEHSPDGAWPSEGRGYNEGRRVDERRSWDSRRSDDPYQDGRDHKRDRSPSSSPRRRRSPSPVARLHRSPPPRSPAAPANGINSHESALESSSQSARPGPAPDGPTIDPPLAAPDEAPPSDPPYQSPLAVRLQNGTHPPLSGSQEPVEPVESTKTTMPPPIESPTRDSAGMPISMSPSSGMKKAPPTGPRVRPSPTAQASATPTRSFAKSFFKSISQPPPTPLQSTSTVVPETPPIKSPTLESRDLPSAMPARASTPPLPSPAPQSAYEPRPYVPPPAVRRRPGLGNFLVTYDPATASTKTGFKHVIKRMDGGEGEGVTVEDSRLKMLQDLRRRGRGSRKVRAELHSLAYEWTDDSFGPRPPLPPCGVLITQLNPLTTVDQISKFLRAHGKIREMDSKMDTRSGMQLGICWVKFEGPLPGKQGSAHDVACHVVKVCDGQRVGLAGDEKIKVVLDGRGLRADKAVKEEMARRYPPKIAKPPAPPAPTAPPATWGAAAAPAVSAVAATPASSGGSRTPMAPPSAPRFGPSGPGAGRFPSQYGPPGRPRPPFNPNHPHHTAYNSPFGRATPARSGFSIQSRPIGVPARSLQTNRSLASSFIDAPFGQPSQVQQRQSEGFDAYTPRNIRFSRSRSRSRSQSSAGDSDSSDEGHERSKNRTRSPRLHGKRGAIQDDAASKADEEAVVEKIKAALVSNGRAYILIDATALPAAKVSDDNLRDHFRAFKPTEILSSSQARYILFADDMGATRAGLLNDTQVKGFKLVLSVKQPSAAAVAKADQSPTNSATAQPTAKGATAWKFLTFTKKGGSAAKPKPTKAARQKPVEAAPEVTSESDSDVETTKKTPAVSYTSSESSDLSEEEALQPVTGRKRVVESPESDNDSVDVPLAKAEPTVEPVATKKEAKGAKRPAKTKAAKGAKKARLETPTIEVETLPAVQPEVAEITIAPEETAQPKVVKPKKPTAGPVGQLIASGDLADEEDAYWLGQALKFARDGVEPDFADDEAEHELDEKHPLYHTSGAWRAEGWKKVPQIAKSAYLPQRNRAVVSTEDAGALTTGRTARVTGRRLALDMETQRKTIASTTAESDLFAFNQLRIRKKQLRFARSAIEGYGLYAMETIQTGEMICEYVGEICRSAVAEIREQRYLKQGIGSSYLFRIDNDLICDATFRGSVSRLINHSCDPSANAKIISINGHSKIVIYARRQLHPGEEILYDYKFPLESDPALRVPCLCGAATCRGWLN